ncbi:isochorismatase family protein [Porphyromonas circumdentaria]|uniref:isochorismatase family protein n=1 Tax=Porphyromonas circumdentaria TaxID=29524 RepID=UPI0026DAC9FF|nr:isochorismatase family protein [Porphyromonas circumdentaria]MDO4722526.1 isochorismatase family protein [Porphyromonas circumdentaria]
MKITQPYTLLVVDPQVDFVSGSLAVPHAGRAMELLTEWGNRHIEEMEALVITSDQHTWDHCSFQANGGLWPPHCIRYTEGAALTPEVLPLVKSVVERKIPYKMVEKATTSERDAYSAFESEVPELLHRATHIVVAGIAGDYCVLQTVRDLLKLGLGSKLYLLEEGIASIDDGSTLRNFIAQEGVQLLQ